MGFSPREFGGQFWALIGATFLGFLGIGTVLPALAPHVRYDLGGSDQTVGFVIGTFSLVLLFSRFFWDKDFVASERWRLQYRAEFFNLFNTPQFDIPNASIGNPAAGRITATIGPNRQIQMGLRLSF